MAEIPTQGEAIRNVGRSENDVTFGYISIASLIDYVSNHLASTQSPLAKTLGKRRFVDVSRDCAGRCRPRQCGGLQRVFGSKSHRCHPHY